MNSILSLVAILFSLTISAQSLAGQKILLISDVDDTIKVSNVRDSLEKVSFAVFKDSLFYGMNLVYKSIEKDSFKSGEVAEFYYLSNGWKPTVVESHGAILNNYNFPTPQNYIARNLKEVLTKVPHKKNNIAKLVNEVQPEILILVGDNGEKDPEVYNEIANKIQKAYSANGKKIKILTYIHTVYKPKNLKTSDLYPGQIPFSNAAELAVLLNEEKIISVTEALKVVINMMAKVKKEKSNSVYGPLVYPYFKYRGAVSDFKNRQCQRVYTSSPFTKYLNRISFGFNVSN